MRSFTKSSATRKEWFNGAHKFEHWYRDRTVYLITSRVRAKRHVFLRDDTRAIFWQKFGQYTSAHGFEPWITTLLSNHYHTVGFLNEGAELGEMMRKLHGSVAWMTCKALDIRHKPFWRDDCHRDYFDGCLRDLNQLTRSYRYVQSQAVRARLVRRAEDYPGTRAMITLEEACRRAIEREALKVGVPYARYADDRRKRGKQVDAPKLDRQLEETR